MAEQYRIFLKPAAYISIEFESQRAIMDPQENFQ
jgi:hypothetical protein